MTQDTTRHDRVESSREKAVLAPPLDTSSVHLETTQTTAQGGGEQNNARPASPAPTTTTVGSVGAAVVSGQERSTPLRPTGDSAISVAEPVSPGQQQQQQQQSQMKAPHISTLYKKKDVMAKHFGVTQKQALRTQALLRLGVTDEDVRIAERLMGPRSTGDNVSLRQSSRVSALLFTGGSF